MDHRTKLEKIQAIADDDRAHPNVRIVAKQMLDRIIFETELKYLSRWIIELQETEVLRSKAKKAWEDMVQRRGVDV